MLIDIHMHPFCKEATWDDLDKMANALWGLDPHRLKRMRPFLDIIAKKTSINDYIALMDKFNIAKSIIVGFNLTTAYGVCMVTNDDLANLVALYPERLIGFACIDFPAPDAMKQLEYAILSLGLKGIKLVPPCQKFDISDKKYDPLWRIMVDLNIPLWTHTGHQWWTTGSIAKFGHPMLVDKLAMRYEELTIIMGHMGTPWFWDLWSVVTRHLNVYADISLHPDLYQYFPWDAFSKYNLEHKLMFASDHPCCHYNQIVPAVKNLPISNSFKEKIMNKNAMNLLKSFN